MTRLFVPADAAALALGADQVVATLRTEAARRGATIEVVRTGTRGMVFLEPLVEVETPAGRMGYGPVTPGDVAGLFDAGLLKGGAHPLAIGAPEQHPWQAGQTRLTFARCGDHRPGFGGRVPRPWRLCRPGLRALDDGRHGRSWSRRSGCPACGAAAVPGSRPGSSGTPSGWHQAEQRKYIVCNADEGDSGTFADRMLMEGDPLCLVEGMTIAAVAVGATQAASSTLRSEYPHAIRAAEARRSAAAEACGAASAPTSSARVSPSTIEVRRGRRRLYLWRGDLAAGIAWRASAAQVRAKPPLPAIQGLFGKPTVVNNVLSLASGAVDHGPGWLQAYAAFGNGRFARHAGGAACRQRRARRTGGAAVRRHRCASVDPGLGRRHRQRPAVPGGAGGRPARRLLSRTALLDTKLDYEAFGAVKRAARPRRRGGVRRHGEPRRPGALRLRVLRRTKAAANARRAAWAPCAAWKRGGPHHRRHAIRPRTWRVLRRFVHR